MSLVFIYFILYTGDYMLNELKIINEIKEKLQEVLEEVNFKYDKNIESLLKFYSSSFVKILSHYYPGSTIMMDKFYRSCSIMINGKVYNEKGEVNRLDYHVALEEEINYINNTFPKIPEYILEKLNDKLNNNGYSKTLKK